MSARTESGGTARPERPEPDRAVYDERSQDAFEPLHETVHDESGVLEAIQNLQLFMEDWRKEQQARYWFGGPTNWHVARKGPRELALYESSGGKYRSSREESTAEERASADSHVPEAMKVFAKDKPKPLHTLKRLLMKKASHLSGVAILTMLKEKPPAPSGRIKRWIALSPTFECLCVSIIVCNALFMAYSANYEAEHVYEPQPVWHYWVELGFCLFYVLEMAVKMFIWRCHYFFCPDWRWNAFDTFVVCISLPEQVVFLYMGSDTTTNISFLRLLRLLKMVKVFRMVRLMRAFREFRMLFYSIAGSFKAAVWAFMLIVCMNFMFGLCVLQGASYYRKTNPDLPGSVEVNLTSSWGSLVKSMLSMYMACTGGIDWNEAADVLYVVGAEYYVGFLLYVAIYTCVVTNTITSLFVESTIAFAERDTQYVISDKLERKDQYVQKLSAWFSSIDTQCCGEITYDQFVSHVDDPDVLAFAETMEIELVDLRQFFAVLSSNGKRKVNLENFVRGCIKLKGMAKSMDLMSLMYSHRDATVEVHSILRRFEENFILELEGIRQRLEVGLATEREHMEESLEHMEESLEIIKNSSLVRQQSVMTPRRSSLVRQQSIKERCRL